MTAKSAWYRARIQTESSAPKGHHFLHHIVITIESMPMKALSVETQWVLIKRKKEILFSPT